MDAKDREILAAIDDAEVVDLEKKMVAIPSYTTEEQNLAEFIADYLNDNGVEVGLQRVLFPDNKKSRHDRSYNVIGRIHGTGGAPSLLFNGHMDHGPIEGRDGDDLSHWARPPFTPIVEGGYLYGKGCQDEKGGICAMLTAAATLKRLGRRLRGDLIVTPVCGHKTYSAGTRHLIASGLRADMAINTENSGNAIVPIHVGVMTAKINLAGGHPHPAHRKRFPQLAKQPSPFARVLALLEAVGPEAAPYDPKGWLRFAPHPVLRDFPWHHVEKVESHGYLGKTVHLWFRTPPGVTAESLKEDLERLIAGLTKTDPGFRAHVETQEYGQALETPEEAPVVQSLARWHRAVSGDDPNVGPEGRYGGYGDAAVLAQAGIVSVAYGPGGGVSDLDYEWQNSQSALTPGERIRIRDLIIAAKVSTLVAAEICG